MSDIQNEKVLIISESWCPYATKTKKLLKTKGVKAKTYECDKVPEGKQIKEVVAHITQQKTVPQVWIGGKHIGGCDQVLELEQNGKLDMMLKEA